MTKRERQYHYWKKINKPGGLWKFFKSYIENFPKPKQEYWYVDYYGDYFKTDKPLPPVTVTVKING